jgi:acyl-CoA synthetase (AMP-forming)/AMP-acid ligase II
LTSDGFYIAGDVFRRDADGFYYFIGGADDMFVSGCENIYPGEIEAMRDTARQVGSRPAIGVYSGYDGARLGRAMAVGYHGIREIASRRFHQPMQHRRRAHS